MNLEKLKDTARKHELKEDWRKAIDVYQKAIQHFETGREAEADLSLYNRVGDLYLKLNDPGNAVQSYERAADLYGEQGFLNNAIALCGKVLRVNPGRVQVYLKLAHLHARKTVVSETKRNLIEYIERMNTLGKLDDAFKQVKTFADQHSGNHDIRMMLVELLRAASRTDEAREQLEKMAGELEARGDRAGARKTRERLSAIAGEGERPAGPVPGVNDLVFIATGFDTAPPASRSTAAPPARPPVEPLAGLETTVPADAGGPEIERFAPPLDLEPLGQGGLVEPAFPDPAFDPAAADLSLDPTIDDLSHGAGIAPLDDLLVEHTSADLALEPTVDTAGLDLDPSFADAAPELDASVASSFNLLPDADLETPDELRLEGGYSGDFEVNEPIELESRVGGNLDFIEVDQGTAPFAPEPFTPPEPYTPEPFTAPEPDPHVVELEERILEQPEEPALHSELAEAVAPSDPARAIDEYVLALAGHEAASSWEAALDTVDAILVLEPDAMRFQQKRVELAYRSGDRDRLLSAYTELADALVRAEAVDKAIAVYSRILEHDPENARARSAMRTLSATAPAAAAAPPPPPVTPPRAAPAPPPVGFVDLRSMVVDEEGPRDTRMKFQHDRPTGDEQKDFLETLEQFKKGIEANLGSEDYEAHYDLGVAFKEMGLLDEAIAEFQKALRAPNGRLRTSEALGITFFEKEQFAIAETILRRGVESLEGADDEKIGLLYWLGRACEAQGKSADARGSYERALAVDIRFMDVSERIRKLAPK